MAGRPAIEFTIRNYRCFGERNPLKFILGRGCTSIIGPNNSGKSSVLKFFYEFRGLWSILIPSSIGNSDFEKLILGSTLPVNFLSGSNPSDLFNDKNSRAMTIEMNFLNQSDFGNVTKMKFEIQRPDFMFEYKLVEGELVGGPTVPHIGGANGNEWWHRIRDDVVRAEHFELIRGLARSIYIGAFRNITSAGGSYFDLQIGAEFVRSWNQWQNGNNKKMNLSIFRVVSELRNLFEFERLEINPNPEQNNLKINVNGSPYHLDEMGSGLTQFIVVLGNLAIRDPGFILIDEPELHLHPKLQVQFLSMIESFASQGVLFCTHSVGLARSASERIYAVTKDKDGSRIEPLTIRSAETAILEDLSYSTFSDVGVKKILLCEGQTDVRVLQHFLRLLKKDHEVAVHCLYGTTLIKSDSQAELAEFKRFNLPVYVLIDSEKPTPTASLEPHRIEFLKNCAALGFTPKALDRRALENYLRERAVKEVKSQKYRELAPFEKLAEVTPAWSKEENSKIAYRMDLGDIAGTDLLTFLEAI